MSSPGTPKPHLFLSRAPVALVLTGLTAVLGVYLALHGDLLPPIAARWGRIYDDGGQFVTYCLAVVSVLSLLIWLQARRYVLVVIAGLWTVTLFGLGAVTAVCALAIAAHLLGTRLLRWSGFTPDVDVSPSLALAFGYAILLATFQLLVLSSAYTRLLVLVVILTSCVLGRDSMVGTSRRMLEWSRERLTRSPGNWLAIVPLTVAAVQLVYASFLESHSDALVAHLMIAHHIFVTGTWSFDAATYHFATMPKGASWLFAAHYLLAGEPAARLFNLFTTFVSGWLVYDFVRRRADAEAGVMLAAVFLSAPLTFWCVFVMFEDALLALFTTAAVVMLVLAWPRLTPRAAALVALALAAGMATKMQGILGAAPIAVALYIGLWRAGSLRTIGRATLLMAVPLLAVGSVPYVVGWLITGNPFFPFYNAVFHSPLFPNENFVDTRWVGKASLGLLRRLTFDTSEFMESLNGAFGFQHFLLLPGVTAALLFVRRPDILIPALCGAGIFVAVSSFTQYARYLYPTFPLLSMAATALWHRASTEHWRRLLVFVLCGLVAVNVFAYRSLTYTLYFLPPNPLAGQARVQPAYPAERRFNSIINDTYGPAARVLYLARSFGAGLDGTPLYVWHHLNWRLHAASKAITDAQSLQAFLDDNAVTHVMSDDAVTPEKHPRFQEHLPEVAVLEAQIGSSKLWRVRRSTSAATATSSQK